MAQTAIQIVRKFQPAKPKNMNYGILGKAKDGERVAYCTFAENMLYDDVPQTYGVHFYHEIHGWVWHMRLGDLDYKDLSKEIERARSKLVSSQ